MKKGHVALASLLLWAGLALLASAQQPEPEPSWTYWIDEETAAVVVSISAAMLREDEQIEKAVCYFEVEDAEHAFAIKSVPIPAGTDLEEDLFKTSESSRNVVGLRLYWEVGVVGRSLSWAESPVRAGSSEPSSRSGGDRGGDGEASATGGLRNSSR